MSDALRSFRFGLPAHYEKTGRRITILYRPPRKEILRAVVGEARQAPGIEAVPTNLAGVKHVIRSLRNGNTFGALPDQVPSNGEGFGQTSLAAQLIR